MFNYTKKSAIIMLNNYRAFLVVYIFDSIYSIIKLQRMDVFSCVYIAMRSFLCFRDPTPEEFTPEYIAPEDATPEDPTPEDPTPEDATPEYIAPEESTPEDTTPEESTPEYIAPEDATPEESTSEYIAQYSTIEYSAMRIICSIRKLSRYIQHQQNIARLCKLACREANSCYQDIDADVFALMNRILPQNIEYDKQLDFLQKLIDDPENLKGSLIADAFNSSD